MGGCGQHPGPEDGQTVYRCHILDHEALGLPGLLEVRQEPRIFSRPPPRSSQKDITLVCALSCRITSIRLARVPSQTPYGPTGSHLDWQRSRLPKLNCKKPPNEHTNQMVSFSNCGSYATGH